MNSRIHILFSIVAVLFTSLSNGQGLVNDSAFLVLNNGATIYIDGPGGHFKNERSGRISSGATDTIKLKGNWINDATNEVLSSNDGVIELLGADQFIGGANSTSFNSLVLSGSGIKTLNTPTTIGGGYPSPNGSLDLTDVPLDLNSHTLTITNQASGSSIDGAIRYASGYIISEDDSAVNTSIVKWKMGGAGNTGNHIIPFGVPGGEQIPLNFNISSIGNTEVSFSTRKTVSDCSPNPTGSCNTPWTSGVLHMNDLNTGLDISVESVIDRWWQIDTNSNVTADLTLTYQGIENTTIDPTGLFNIQRWNNSQWDLPTGTGVTGVATGTGSVSSTSVTSFGTFVLSLFSNPLPVEFINLDVQCKSDGIEFHWVTASESNNDYFTLEKSRDGINFIFIARIRANGTSSGISNYHFFANGTNSESPFYRLTQTDYDGRQTELKTIRKVCQNEREPEISSFPNPINGQELNIRISGIGISEQISFSMYDIIGKSIFSNKEFISDDQGNISTKFIFSEGLAAGMYSLIAKSGSQSLIQKIIVR